MSEASSNLPRVGFLCAGDPLDPTAFSGTLYWMRRSLEEAGCDVRLLGRDAVVMTRWQRWKRRLVFKFVGKGVTWTSGLASKQAEAIGADVARERPEVVFAPVASGLVGGWRFGDVPIVHCTDATPKLLFGGVHDRYKSDAARKRFDASDADERAAVAKASATIASSTWAADSLVADYGAEPASVHVVPLGANVAGTLSVAEVEAKLDARDAEAPLRLVWIGTSWEGKGGPVAAAAVAALNRRGVPAELHVVGAKPEPAVGEALPEGVIEVGWIDKRNPDDVAKLDRLMRSCDALVLPTRADTFAVVIAEAHAYGMPAFVSDTGGVGSAVADGVTGRLLGYDVDGQAWADALSEAWADRDGYRAMALAARRRYEDVLNWSAWGRATAAVLAGVHGESSAAA